MGTEITGLDTGCWLREVDSTKALILSLIGVSSKSSASFDSELTNGIGTSGVVATVAAVAVAAAAAGGVADVEVVAVGAAAVAVPNWLLLLE